MTISTETFLESKWRTGKSFIFLHSELVFAGGATENLVICTGDAKTALSSLAIEADAESLSWKAYEGTQHIPGTGTLLNEIKRNSNADTVSGVTIEINPTISQNGQAFFPTPIELVALVAAGNRAYVQEQLLSGLFSLLPNTCYLIELTNNDIGPNRYDININVIVE